MILSYRHKGLKEFARSGCIAGISPNLASRIKKSLQTLESVSTVEEIKNQAIHPMTKGSALDGYWSLKISAQWRLTFQIADKGNFYNLDLINYH